MNNNLSNIKKSKFFLDKGHCVAIPTETVYGLAANAYSDTAVKKIYKLKKRPKNNPSIVHYSNLKKLKNDCELNKNFFILYKKFCPGPITFILKLKKNSKISNYVTNNKNTVAIRFPKHKVARELLKKLNYPLAAPSANISTKISAVSPEDVKDEFGEKIKFVLNGGRSKIGLESTIINLASKPEILRLGGIEINRLSKVLGLKLKFNNSVKKFTYPGQGKIHYSPHIPIRLNIKKENSDTYGKLSNKEKNRIKKNEITGRKLKKINHSLPSRYACRKYQDKRKLLKNCNLIDFFKNHTIMPVLNFCTVLFCFCHFGKR